MNEKAILYRLELATSMLEKSLSHNQETHQVIENILFFTTFSTLEKLNQGLKEPMFSINSSSLEKDFQVPSEVGIPKSLEEVIEVGLNVWGHRFPEVIYQYFIERNKDAQKSKGAYSTPEYIVKYMVYNSVVPFLDQFKKNLTQAIEKKDITSLKIILKELDKFRILDPSCGSGIFTTYLCKVVKSFYEHIKTHIYPLLNHSQLHKYIDDENVFFKKHIYALDLNPLAIKVTKYMCRLLTGVTPSLIQENFIKYVSLKSNLKNFHIVIGNPPYFTIGGGGKGRNKGAYWKTIRETSLFKNYFRTHSDIFYYFIMGGIELLKTGGVLSYIVPSYWLENEYADLLRKKLIQECTVEEIVDFSPYPVFKTILGKKVEVDVMTFKAKKGRKKKDLQYFSCNSNNVESFLNKVKEKKIFPVKVPQSFLSCGKWIFSKPKISFKIDGIHIIPLGDVSLKEKEKYPSLFSPSKEGKIEGVCLIGQGQESGLSKVFVVSIEEVQKLHLESEILRPNIKGKHIHRWQIEKTNQFLIFTLNETPIENYSHIKKYLTQYKSLLSKRHRVLTNKRKWYALSIPQNLSIFNEIPKIVVPYRALNNRFALDSEGHLNDGGDVRAIVIKEKWRGKILYRYLLAFLNSKWVNVWYNVYGKRKGNLLEFFSHPLSRIPIIIPPLKVQKEVEKWVLSIEENIKNPSKVKSLEGEIEKIIEKIYKRA